MSQYPAQPYGVQVQQVPQPGYGQPQMGYGQPPHPQAMVDRTVYVNGVPGHYEVVQYPGPITCLSCLLTVWFFPLNFLVFCCPCDKKTEFCPHGSMVGVPGGMPAAPPGATVTYYQQPQPVAQYQQPPQQQPGYYPKT